MKSFTSFLVTLLLANAPVGTRSFHSSAWAASRRHVPSAINTRGTAYAGPRMVLGQTPKEADATYSSPSSSNLVSLDAAISTTLADKRRIDELVGQFLYDGEIVLDGVVHAGQGAVKRVLTDLLLHSEATSASIHRLVGDSALLKIRSEQGDRELHLSLEAAAASSSGAVIERLTLTSTQPPVKEARPAPGDARTGPKWETFDGRVRQQIWQHSGIFDAGNPFLLEKLQVTEGRLIVIVDQTVWRLHGHKIQAWCDSMDLELHSIVAPGNEDQKTMDNMLYMLGEIAKADPLRRSEPVLAVGGGVLTDVAGFACAVWRRGVPWSRVPTTLLGMVDASVGIKVAVNHHRKNGVGHFFSPSHTFVDESFLETLPVSEVKAGAGEIMKAALVHDPTLFDLMEAHGERLIREGFMGSAEASKVIKYSVDTMLECIGPDLWEESLVRPMDFGHSFSRTLEGEEKFQLRHGEAVAIDCIMSTCIANQKRLVSDEELQRVLNVYAVMGLPCSIEGITADTYKRALKQITVHRDGLLRAPLPQGIGGCTYVDSISDQEVEQAFERLSVFMREHPETSWSRDKGFSAEYGLDPNSAAESGHTPLRGDA